jgi:acetyl-CoA acetyltransferase
MNDPIVIVSATRTPIGAMLGEFSAIPAAQLGAVAIKAAVERAGIKADAVEEIIFAKRQRGKQQFMAAYRSQQARLRSTKCVARA